MQNNSNGSHIRTQKNNVKSVRFQPGSNADLERLGCRANIERRSPGGAVSCPCMATRGSEYKCNCKLGSGQIQGITPEMMRKSVSCSNGSPDEIARGGTFAPDWNIEEVNRRIPYTVEIPVKHINNKVIVDMSPFYPYPTYWYNQHPIYKTHPQYQRYWKGHPIYNLNHPEIEDFTNKYCKNPYFYAGLAGLIVVLMALNK
jgi:hypothetical protein